MTVFVSASLVTGRAVTQAVGIRAPIKDKVRRIGGLGFGSPILQVGDDDEEDEDGDDVGVDVDVVDGESEEDGHKYFCNSAKFKFLTF